MLIDKLQTAMDRIQALSPQQQEALADQIDELLDEMLWDAQFTDPQSETFFDEMLADARHGHPCPPSNAGGSAE